MINNQIGFTTPPEEARSGHYATDIARAVQAPIWHVNGDDPEAVVRAAHMAYDFRQEFKKDVVLDIVCYRRNGHNEGDDPTYTQPVMYQKIKVQPTVLTQYGQRLVREKLLSQADLDARKKAYLAKLSDGYDAAMKNAEAYELVGRAPRAGVLRLRHLQASATSLPTRVINGLTNLPADFHLHPKLKGFMDKRREAFERRSDGLGARGSDGVWQPGSGRHAGPPQRSGCRTRHLQPAPPGTLRRGERQEVRSDDEP